MRRVEFTRFGDPGVLQIIQRARPEPAAGEVRVRVAASGVNPSDILMRSGEHAALMKDLAAPYIPGMEFAGVVDAAGAGVTDAIIGQRVMGAVNPRRPQGGAHADWICVPLASVTEVPAAIDLVVASTVPMNGLTALHALDFLNMGRGSTLLVTGGAGALGGFVIELTRLLGIRVVADAHAEDAPLLRSLGAAVIVPRGERMAEAVRETCPDGVDGLLDAALLGPVAAPLVRDGGSAVSVRRSHVIQDPRLRVTCANVTQLMTDAALLRKLQGHFAAGQITPRVAARFSPEAAPEAHRLLERGGLRGRVVLVFE